MTQTLIFDAGDFEVHFSMEALSIFDAHRQTRFFHREAGGQMFGNVRGTRWVIEHATGPRRSDRRSRFGFRPNRVQEQREIEAFHARGSDYLGDWHTHPEDVPTASSKDETTITDIVRQSRHHLPGFLLCIVGRSSFPPGLWVSFHDRDGGCRRCEPRASATS